jgi:PAS domain S-box-containing protein
MYINQRWYDYTGLKEDKAFQDIYNECILEQEENYKLWVEQKSKRESYQTEVQIKRHDGTYRWHLHKARYIPQTNSWVGTFTDIHDQKLYNQQLADKNQQLITINTDLDNFIYTASHDLKSPIANLEGLTLALTKKISYKALHDEEQNKILSLMASSVKRLKSTIANLTEIAKAQKEHVEEEMVSIEKVVEEIHEDLGNQIRESHAKIHTHMEIYELKFAPKNIRSIMYNLLSNAIKYRSYQRTPQIRIETRKEGDNILIRVEDNGIGMSENHLQKLFTMFRRFHTHVEGTGIGLYIVKRIVENAGGKIEVESKVDVGTTFSVYLPLG